MTVCPFPHGIVILEGKELNLDKLHESSFSEHADSSLRHEFTSSPLKLCYSLRKPWAALVLLAVTFS